MAKPNGKRSNGRSACSTQQTQPGNGRQRLEKLTPSFAASFESASQVYQALNMSLEIEVDKAFLESVIERIHDDDAKVFASWIERFAETCKSLGKVQEKLEEEYTARWEATNKLGREYETTREELSERHEKLAALEQDLQQREQELVGRAAAQAQKAAELTQKARGLNEREINAEAGFAEQNAKALRDLEARQREQRKEFELSLQTLQDEKRKLDTEIQAAARQLADIKYKQVDAQQQRLQQLEEREREVEKRESDLKRARERLDREWSDLKETRESMQQLVATEVEQERKVHAAEVSKLEAKLNNAWAKVQDAKEQLADLRELKAELGERSAPELLEQLSGLREENRKLRRDIDQSDIADTRRENEHLRNRVADLERDIGNLRPELDVALRELSVKRIGATELEETAKFNRLLKNSNNMLTAHIDDLESRIDQLTNSQKTQTPFPAMSLMDSEKEFRSTMELEDVPALNRFADELQHRIAWAEKRVRLYYPIEDIRVLLGGLAMSQLHVFQGISGTGKTSLAKAFAKAVGGFCTDVAVQAGWRDRDDLLGHYNAFERRFYEKDALQALYQAQTPRWQDTCNIVLLDEMNLSRPEQYFAEFLSALEKNDPNERLISLSETALPNAPVMLHNGRQILVPANVWFIGTANHDETTNELADKTYDRAHVMTLPKQDRRFKTHPLNEACFSFRSLKKAFDNACASHEAAVSSLLNEMTSSDFTKQLGSHFGLGWGNRFEQQALRFIPVMLEAGATNGQALDHLLSTRVMRNGKVTGRYDVVADDLRKLQDSLESFWIGASLDGDPVKSLELLDTDIRRIEGGV